MRNKLIKYASRQSERYILEMMRRQGADGYIKKGTFTNEIVWGSYSYIIPCSGKRSQKAFKSGMFLFGMVRSDARKYLLKHKIRLPKKRPQVEYARNVDESIMGRVAGTDLNHAYWRIALNLGVISPNTYAKGLDDKLKSVRLAALSTLGADKRYQRIKSGDFVKDYHVVKGDPELQKVYTMIRLTCYKYMSQVKKMLGDDFLAYKTDAIYYADRNGNRQMVRKFFKEKDLLMKQLA